MGFPVLNYIVDLCHFSEVRDSLSLKADMLFVYTPNYVCDREVEVTDSRAVSLIVRPDFSRRATQVGSKISSSNYTSFVLYHLTV